MSIDQCPLEEVPPGYKRTEVGEIPEDWKLDLLGNVVEFLDEKRRPIKSSDRERITGVYPYYGASGVVDYVNDYLFDEELILLGEDGENILSRNLPLAFKVSGKIWVNNHAHVLRPHTGVNIDYLTAYLESLDYSQYNSGTAQPKLTKKTCAQIPVLLPPAPRRFEWNSPGNLCQITRKIRNEEPEWTATRYCFLGWV